MQEFDMVNLLREFGLGACLSLSVFGVMFWLVKNTMSDHREERKSYQAVIQNHLTDTSKALDKVCDKFQEHDQNQLKALDKVCDKLQEHDHNQQEVNRYAREEHREMLNVLVKLNNK